MKKNGKAIYPVEPWRITEENPSLDDCLRNGTIFFLGNGYLGVRGGPEESAFEDSPVHKGTYINGFYETEPLVYGEWAYGFAQEKQVMLNLADATEIRVVLRTPSGGEAFSPDRGKLHASRRYLDMKEGLLRREVTWESPGGTILDLDITRMVSLMRNHLVCMVYRIRPVNGPVSLDFFSALNGRVTNIQSDKDPRVGSGLPLDTLKTEHRSGGAREAELVQRAARSRLVYAGRTEHVLLKGTPLDAGYIEEGDKLINRIGVSADQREEILLVKYCAYASNREPGEEDPLETVRKETAFAVSAGVETLLREHREYLSRFWERADIRIEGDEVLQQGLRFNLLALLQSAGRDGIRSIAAKGLSGEGYEGHYFWDTEIYVLPFFIHTFPDIARALLLYRYSILDKARERATVLSERGALFPWRTIAGDEASAYFPAGTAQYHINADIVYGLEKYYRATGDTAFLKDYGAEIAFETARLWMSLGDFIESRGGKFCLNCVTGPDEYTALVNNNLYTNIMARGNLEFALKAAEYLKKEAPDRWKLLKNQLSLEEEELKGWRAAVEDMYLPYDTERGIHPQDDSFLDKEVWDFQNTPEENYPLLLHYHPLVIYRHQVLKQPDVVLAMFLQGKHFSRADKRRNFLYYDGLTTGDSSLGPCIRSVAAAEQGEISLAYTYFMTTARMDLDDVNGNVKDGVHTAAMAGTWISLVYGFGGMRKKNDELFFDPKLPKAWKSLEFRVRYKANELAVFLTEKEVRYSLIEGESLAFYHQYTPVALSSGQTRTLSLLPRLEGILFDLDGVVTDTAELHYRAWKRLTEELGIPFDRRVNEELKGIGRKESFEIILRHAGVSMTVGEIASHIEVKNGYYGELLQEMTPQDILPGVMEFLKDLKSRKIKTALISASRNAPFIVDRLKLRDFFDIMVSPDEVVIGKPDPEICFVAAEKLGLPARHCAGIEDAAAGISAIRSAGMFSVGIGPAAAGADLPLAETKELSFLDLEEAFLKRWGGILA